MSRRFNSHGSGSELSLRRILTDSTLASAVFSVLVLGSLAYDPEIWHNDYPAEMKAKAGPQSEKAKRLTVLLLFPLLLVFIGSLVYSNLRLKRENGGRLSFRAALVNAYALFNVINLFDTLILDYLLLTKMKPGFAVLPGTEGMDVEDYVKPMDHVKNFGKGMIWGVVLSLPVPFFTSRDEGQR